MNGISPLLLIEIFWPKLLTAEDKERLVDWHKYARTPMRADDELSKELIGGGYESN